MFENTQSTAVLAGGCDLSRRRSNPFVRYCLASTRADRIGAFRLVYRSYLQAKLCDPNPFRMRVTPYHLLPTTEVFNAVADGEVVCTITLVMDGELGLPMESVYDVEVEKRRARGIRLAEVSCLADQRDHLCNALPVFLEVCRLMVQYARHHKIDQLMVAVHPRHARFYRRFLAFEGMGDVRAYPSVRNRPAVALSLDLNRIEQDRPSNYDRFFAEAIHPRRLESKPISWLDCEYFRPMVDPAWRFVPVESAPVSVAHSA